MYKNINTYQLVFPTPFGEMALSYVERPFLIQEVCLPCQNRTDPAESVKRIDWGISGAHPHAIELVDSIIGYFHGRFNPRTWPSPPWAWMNLDRFTPLQQSTLKAVAEIPYGQLRSYKWVAKRIGRLGAARFVGTTMAHNPYPILIPCHRVIRSDGKPGQFGGGADLKLKMIALEKKHSTCVCS